MAELMFDNVDLRRADGSVKFYISRGWLDEPADIRGVNTIVPGLSGRTYRPKVRDKRTVILNGMIAHESTSGLLEIQLELADMWRPDLGTADLVVSDGYLGLEEGETATLTCITLNVAVSEAETAFLRRYSWELECIESPPEWVLSGSGS